MFRALSSHYQEVKIVLYSIWYRHKEISEWSKKQFYKYVHTVVKMLFVNFSGVITLYYLLQTC